MTKLRMFYFNLFAMCVMFTLTAITTCNLNSQMADPKPIIGDLWLLVSIGLFLANAACVLYDYETKED